MVLNVDLPHVTMAVFAVLRVGGAVMYRTECWLSWHGAARCLLSLVGMLFVFEEPGDRLDLDGALDSDAASESDAGDALFDDVQQLPGGQAGSEQGAGDSSDNSGAASDQEGGQDSRQPLQDVTNKRRKLDYEAGVTLHDDDPAALKIKWLAELKKHEGPQGRGFVCKRNDGYWNSGLKARIYEYRCCLSKSKCPCIIRVEVRGSAATLMHCAQHQHDLTAAPKRGLAPHVAAYFSKFLGVGPSVKAAHLLADALQAGIEPLPDKKVCAGMGARKYMHGYMHDVCRNAWASPCILVSHGSLYMVLLPVTTGAVSLAAQSQSGRRGTLHA